MPIKKTQIILFVLVIVLSHISLACLPGGACGLDIGEPTVDIKIHNQTDETLQIFIDGEVYLGRASPGGEVVWEIERILPHYKVTAKDMDGSTVFVVTWTREDLQDREKYDVYLPPSSSNP